MVSIIDRHAGNSGQFVKSVSENYFQKSSLKRDGPVFFQIEVVKLRVKKMKKQSHPKALPPAWRAAFQRLDTALRENTSSNNARKIAILRKVAFADVERLKASGEVIIPTWKP
jgi:hypothetical protein